MAIFVRGDVHGNFNEITDFIDRFKLNENDTIIVLGDFSLYWQKNGKDAKSFIDYYEANYTTYILWIDGNHENFDLIDQLPNKTDAPFKQCSEHIHYIPRGTVFYLHTPDGIKSCLACGGADSVDKFRRIKHLTWWEQETITKENINECIDRTRGQHIDYVFTHCCPLSIFKKYAPWLINISGVDQSKVNHDSEERLDELMNAIDFDKWYFGHYHINKQLDDKFTCLFTDFIQL